MRWVTTKQGFTDHNASGTGGVSYYGCGYNMQDQALFYYTGLAGDD